jgi:hypothetical protein
MQRLIPSKFHCRLVCMAGCFACCVGPLKATDISLNTITPTEKIALNPCLSVSNTSVQAPDHAKHEAVRIVCGGIVSWSIPPSASSFKVTLWRAASTGSPSSVSTDINPVRLRLNVDGKTIVDAAPRISTPPETWTIPVVGGKVLSARLDQETGTDSVFLMDAAFSSQPVSIAKQHHTLEPGAGYINMGNGPRQIAFYDYYAEETIPVQAEFAGNSSAADVKIQIRPLYGGQLFTTSLTIPLRWSEGESIGNSQWKVPSSYGPCTFQLQMSVQGHQVYSRSANIAISKQVDVAGIKNSNFGIHISTSGSPLLQDDFAGLWGAKWARVFLRWDRIEAQQGRYDWTTVDSLINSYLQQHLFILGVMGEVPPKWVTPAELSSTYTKFVEAALEHFRGKIRYWDIYNEIDSKYFNGMGFDRNADPQGDIKILQQEMDILRQFDPSLIKVCCSTGGTEWLQYDKRLFDAGLLKQINIVSMHPYQSGPPEGSDNGLNYVEMVQRLESLTASYGQKKPVWSTEANWLIGPGGTPGVTAPDVTEHQQSQYVVRANLISLGLNVPYYLHSPFFTGFHREVLVDSLASYAEMTSILSDAQNAKLLQLPEGIYGISASTPIGTVLALWSTRSKGASVHVSGLQHPGMSDMYGNTMNYTGDPVLSGSPIYITGQGMPTVSAAAPFSGMRAMATLSSQAATLSLPPVQNWSKGQRAQTQTLQQGTHVSAPAVKYDGLLVSPVFTVSPNSCYIIRPDLTLHRGGVGVVISDPDTHKNLKAEYMHAYTGNDEYTPSIWIQTQNHSHLQVIIQAANPHDLENTEFDLTGVQISPCP